MLKNIESKQINKNVNKKDLNYLKIIAPVNSFQLDLTFYDQYKLFNDGFSCLLTIININTR